jgi:hypothetical protein
MATSCTRRASRSARRCSVPSTEIRWHVKGAINNGVTQDELALGPVRAAEIRDVHVDGAGHQPVGGELGHSGIV